MYKIYTNVTTENGRKLAAIFADTEKKEGLIYLHDEWEYREELPGFTGTSVSNPGLRKTLSDLLKTSIVKAQLNQKISECQSQIRTLSRQAFENFGAVCPSGSYLKKMLENKLPANCSVCSWTVSPDGPHSITLKKDVDLGTHCSLVGGYEDEGRYLNGDEKTLIKRYAPALINLKNVKTKKIKIEKAEQGYSFGDKRSLYFDAEYYITIPKLTAKTVNAVIEEIEAFAKLI